MIALFGIGNSGKTTTISLVYDHFLRQQGVRVIDPGERGRRRRQPGAREIKGAILEIDGVKVGITTPGDRPFILTPCLEVLIAKGCAVLVCATHTRGDTVAAVRRLASEAVPPFKLVWIQKACQQVDHEDGNRKKAEEVISAVRKAVAEAQQPELVEA
jgi:hypothetical protein